MSEAVCAVSMRETSEARNKTGPTISSGRMTSLMHCFATWAASPSSVTHNACCRSVITQPGAIALTLMPSRPKRPASPLVSPMMPALAAV